jgi:hypothetical protein
MGIVQVKTKGKYNWIYDVQLRKECPKPQLLGRMRLSMCRYPRYVMASVVLIVILGIFVTHIYVFAYKHLVVS